MYQPINHPMYPMYHPTLALPSLYCAFLNTGGRILFDAIISAAGEERFLVEVDQGLAAMARKHLMLYRIRKKVTIKLAEEEVHVVFREEQDGEEEVGRSLGLMTRSEEPGATFCDGGRGGGVLEDLGGAGVPDPRLAALGHRLVVPALTSPLDLLPPGTRPRPPAAYTALRHRLGVAEGAAELVTGKALPLEYNLDYLQGVSFHKGCYIGQELTARTHHTGVIRKRVLPILLQEEVEVEVGAAITGPAGRAVGKVLRVEGRRGLGLVRLKEGLGAEGLRVGEVGVEVEKCEV